MNFETHLLNGIPQADAADFFLRVRGKYKEATAADLDAALAALPAEERAELLKAATGMPGVAPLPQTARGMNMAPAQTMPLPPSATGQQAAPGMKVAASDKTPEETGKERARAALSAEFEKEKAHRSESRFGGAGGALGALAGGLATHHYGKGNPVATVMGAALGHHLGKGLGRSVGAGEDAHRHAKHASAFKVALEQTGITPQLDPATQQLLQMQQIGDQAAEQNEAQFLRMKLQMAQQEAQESTAKAQQLEAAQAQHETETAQIQQQVSTSIQQATAAQDQVLQQQQAAAAMRMAFQQLRGTLLEAASQEPPSLTPAPATDAANAAASQAAGPNSAPAPTAGPAGEAASPGTAPGSPAPMGDAQVSAPSAANEPMFGTASPTNKVEQQEPTGDAKMSHYIPLTCPAEKTAALRDFLAQQLQPAMRVLPHAAVGALAGAGIGAGEALTSNEPLRQKVQGLEGKEDRGFRDTLNLAQSRARLTAGEFAAGHPGVAMGMGALGGAALGAMKGPAMVDSAKRSAGHLAGIGSDLKDIITRKGAA